MPDDDVYPSLNVPTPPRDPDEQRWKLESAIGSRVLLGAGLVSLLAGSVFFVKLSDDHHWIPPEIRIVCGLLAGLALMLGGAWRLGKVRTLVAEGITGLGASVLYLSLWGAFGPFHLIDYRVAFAAMVAVSATLALIAWSRKRETVALLGLAGGYLTPVLLIAGPFDRVVLAVYLAVISGVMLALAVRCGYRRVEAASFVAALLYAPVFAPSTALGDVWTSTQSLLVASVLFAEFALALFFAARREQSVSVARIVLLAAEVFAYLAALELELNWNGPVLALADAVFAAVLLAAVTARVPAAMRSAYAWLGIGILTRAVEAWGGGHALTATIAIEGTALVYTGLRADRAWMRTGGFALLGLATAGALVHLFGDSVRYAVFNVRTFTLAAVAMALLATLAELRSGAQALRQTERELAPIVLIVITLLSLGAITADAITATAADGGVWTAATQTTISVLWSVAATVLVALGFRFRWALARWLGIGLFGATIYKVFALDMTGLDVIERVVSALVLGAVLVAVAGLYQFVMLRRRAS
ncbi:MAG: hypothetical protein QOD51_4 [Candidatus Eremiobacteraeota bacterium]|nr:hypothetical protein [Candidatus Eremiobacteraeota bacterium]